MLLLLLIPFVFAASNISFITVKRSVGLENLITVSSPTRKERFLQETNKNDLATEMQLHMPVVTVVLGTIGFLFSTLIALDIWIRYEDLKKIQVDVDEEEEEWMEDDEEDEWIDCTDC